MKHNKKNDQTEHVDDIDEVSKALMFQLEKIHVEELETVLETMNDLGRVGTAVECVQSYEVIESLMRPEQGPETETHKK